MCIVSSVSYSFILNGAPKGFLRPSRGILQGDPLSPYLFLLCVEGLTSMLRMMEARRALTGLKIRRGSPSVSHILFAEDTFVFCRATVEEGETFMQILEDYELASGHKVNVEKTTVSFERRTRGRSREAVMRILKMKEVEDQGKYLGLTSHISRTKKEFFKFVRKWVDERIKGWKGKLLSQPRNEVLIKAVATTIPNYVRNYFKLLLA
ncbi:hypothetical protein LIER_35086 [Lithospermum erythrorhizon]|uniref:Reverse transcriptase domain-containing protein n=1 Tax=Lithospermum erythrorhizon TaxID=34254 RepID=A0AAV3NKR8_LITER